MQDFHVSMLVSFAICHLPSGDASTVMEITAHLSEYIPQQRQLALLVIQEEEQGHHWHVVGFQQSVVEPACQSCLELTGDCCPVIVETCPDSHFQDAYPAVCAADEAPNV